LTRWRGLSSVSDERFAILLILPYLIFALVLVFYPLAYSFWLSLNNANLFLGGNYVFVGFGQYSEALSDPKFYASLLVTLQYTFETLVMSTFLGLGFALLLNEPMRGRSILRAIVLLPWAVAAWAAGAMFRYVLDSQFGTLNGLLNVIGLLPTYAQWITYDSAVSALSVATAWNITPLGAFFILAALQTIPEELMKASKIDGAGVIRRFRYVVLPYIRYAFLITVVVNTLLVATSLDTLFLLTTGGPGRSTTSLTFRIFQIAYDDLNLGGAAATSFILVAVISTLTIAYFVMLRGTEGRGRA
jgi:multiple sugar transport system permease protein